MGKHRYTEEAFRAALDDPSVRTVADLCRALGLVPRGANYETLRAFAADLDIDLRQTLAWRRLGISDEQLADAVSDCETMTELVQRLGVSDGGNARLVLRRRIDAMGLTQPNGSSFAVGPDGLRGPTSYTDEELLAALEEATDYPSLCRLLGLRTSSTTHRRLQRRASELGQPIPEEWSRPGPKTRSIFDRSALVDALDRCISRAAVLRALGQTVNPTSYAKLQRSLDHYGLDASHLNGRSDQLQSRGKPLDELLVRGRLISGVYLKRRLLEEGIKEARCEGCGLAEWRGEPIPLEVDHINGDRFDNRLENLQLLCPNCHALTPTYRGRNIGRRSDEGP